MINYFVLNAILRCISALSWYGL